MRLKIMAALNRLAADAALEFTRLRGIVEATDGNLGAHIEALERAGYVTTTKSFEARKPQTRIRITPAGRKAFAEHVAYLNDIIHGGPSA
jgi:DNA-binding MarR family transcriptional regulator